MSERPNCLSRGDCQAKTVGRHCRRCAMIAVRTVDHLNAWRSTPEGQKIQRDRAMVRLAKMNSPDAIADRKIKVRRQRLGWCPPARVDEYLALARRVGAPEAKRLILDDEQIKARRSVQASLAAQRERQQRQSEGAY